MADNVHKLEVVTVGPGYVIPPDTILGNNVGKLDELVLIGIDKDGDLVICGSHDNLRTLWRIVQAQRDLTA